MSFLSLLGFDAKQRQLAQLAEGCRTIRSYSRSIFPGIVQLPEYSREIFRSIGLDSAAAEAAVHARKTRAKVLEDKECWFIFDENALYSKHPADSDPAILSSQLEYVAKISHRPNLHIFVLPGKSSAPSEISNQFLLLDQRYASETVLGEQTTTDVRELASYRKVFDQLVEHAVTGDQLRKHIEAAIRQCRGHG